MVQESCSSLQSSLSSLATSGVIQPASAWCEDTTTLSSAIVKFTESQGAGIAAATETVSQYISQEMTVDIPTGNVHTNNSLVIGCTLGKTPQRRDFSYPQNLAHSRPHSELLRDFQPAISLPSLPESDNEDEDTCIIEVRNTLPLYV